MLKEIDEIELACNETGNGQHENASPMPEMPANGPLVVHVPSSKDPAVSYDVSRSAEGVWSCTCRGFAFRKQCRHVTAVIEGGARGGSFDDQVRAALEMLQTTPARDPVTQQFVPGNTTALTTGAHSETFWAALAPAKRAIVARIEADFGLASGEAAETFLGLVDAYAESTLLRKSLFLRMGELGGPITTKGRARQIYRAYGQALDRELKLATTLGLERRGRSLTKSPREYLEAQASTQEHT